MFPRQLSPIYLLVLTAAFPALTAHAQITDYAGDGVLNAPYRGTVTSLREACMAIPYGEVMNQTEPRGSNSTITSSSLEIWHEPNVGVQLPWDRSVVRMYRGLDASGPEIDLTSYTPGSPLTISPPATLERFSFKAIGTKTFANQTFKVFFRYKVNNGSSYTTPSNTLTVAPVTGSFLSLPGESEAFHFGTPILDVGCGNAQLVVRTGHKAEMIGTGFVDYLFKSNPATSVANVVFPGTAESVFIPNDNQCWLGDWNKHGFGTPWPGYLPGYFLYYGGSSGSDRHKDPSSPDGTLYDCIGNDSLSSFTGQRTFKHIRPYRLPAAHPATQTYEYDGLFVTQIHDNGVPPNAINLVRDVGTGRVTSITTSESPPRSWTIESDVSGWITGIIPSGGVGPRHYSPQTDRFGA